MPRMFLILFLALPVFSQYMETISDSQERFKRFADINHKDPFEDVNGIADLMLLKNRIARLAPEDVQIMLNAKPSPPKKFKGPRPLRFG